MRRDPLPPMHPQMYPCLPIEFVAATLLHLGLVDDDLRAGMARKLLRLEGYLDHLAPSEGGCSAAPCRAGPA